MLSEHNLPIPEKDYRDLDYPSYSMLASISKHGIDIMTGVKNLSFNLKFGSLVDDLCFEPTLVEGKYHEGKLAKPPTPNVRKIIDQLVVNIQPAGTNNPFVTVKPPSSNISKWRGEILRICAQQKVYKSYTDDKTFETVKKQGRVYFRDMLESKGKIFINKDMWEKAHITANTLVTHPFSRKYFIHKPGYELFYQFKFVTKVDGRATKGMLDCVRVDHNRKIIYPVDLKTGEAPVDQFDQVMLMHKYYIQAALYREALIYIVSQDPEISDYTVAPFEFLYISKENIWKPLVWVVPEELHQAALEGFTDVYGSKHVGVHELLDQYYDCKDGRHCTYTKRDTVNKGRIMLDNIIRK